MFIVDYGAMVVVSQLILCPLCRQAAPVVRHGTNRNGSHRFRCKVCAKTFTPTPNRRLITSDKEAQVLAALSERLSIVAVARLFGMSRQTVYQILKKNRSEPATEPDSATG